MLWLSGIGNFKRFGATWPSQHQPVNVGRIDFFVIREGGKRSFPISSSRDPQIDLRIQGKKRHSYRRQQAPPPTDLPVLGDRASAWPHRFGTTRGNRLYCGHFSFHTEHIQFSIRYVDQ